MAYIVNLIVKDRLARLEPLSDDLEFAKSYGQSEVDLGHAQSVEVRDEDGTLAWSYARSPRAA